LPARPPAPEDPARCFLCRPEQDPGFLGLWDGAAAALAVLGNLFPVLPGSLLLAPAGSSWHEPGRLPPAALVEEMLRLPLSESFGRRFAGTDPICATFFNLGLAAGQTRGHLHSQILRGAEAASPAVRAAVNAELQGAGARGDCLEIAGGLSLVLPSRPAMTAEAWLAFDPVGPAYSASQHAAGLAQVLRALEGGISASFNLVALPGLKLLRILPRGISERAGLEFALPGWVHSVVACSPAEARELWGAALERAGRDP
jgi:hypothetical protein